MSSSDPLELPKMTINKMISEIIPNNIRVSTDTKDLIAECGAEFVSLITVAALQSAENNAKVKNKTEQNSERGVFLGGQDIINAMHELGFDDYIKEMETIRDAYKENAKQKAQKRKYDEADEALQKQLLGVWI